MKSLWYPGPKVGLCLTADFPTFYKPEILEFNSFLCPKPEKCTLFGRSLPAQAIIGSTHPPLRFFLLSDLKRLAPDVNQRCTLRKKKQQQQQQQNNKAPQAYMQPAVQAFCLSVQFARESTMLKPQAKPPQAWYSFNLL